MAIRRLVLAALLVSAGMAQAEVVQTAASNNFLTDWTNGKGTDVIASGALSDNVTLIGGISHGASASLEDVLFGKVSAQQASASGTQLKYASGVQGNYLLGTDNGALAARLGNSKSVVNTNDGVTVLDGVTKPGLGNGTDSTPALSDIPGKGLGLDKGEGNAQPAQIPEPSSVALMLAGLAGATSLLGRRRKQ